MTSRPHPTTHHGLIAALLIGTALCALAVSPHATTAQQQPGTEGLYIVEIYADYFYNPNYTVGPTDIQSNVVSIPVGATVTWIMKDVQAIGEVNDIVFKDPASVGQIAVNHSVTSDDGTFESGPLPNVKTRDDGTTASADNDPVVYTRTFTAPGTFTYHDRLHPAMVGTVIVTGGDVVVFR